MASVEKLTGNYLKDRAHICDEHGRAYAMPGPYAGVEHVKELHARRGGHYFEDDTMRFFSGRVDPHLYGGRIFIDSVRYANDGREYRASVLDLDSRSVSRVRGLDGHPIEGRKLDHVRRDVRALLDSVGVSEWAHDRCPPCVARCAMIAEYLDGMPISSGGFSHEWERYSPAAWSTERCRYEWQTIDAHATYTNGEGTRAHIRIDESGMYCKLTDSTWRAELDVRLPYAAGVVDFVDAIGKAAWQVSLIADRLQESSPARETLDHTTPEA